MAGSKRVPEKYLGMKGTTIKFIKGRAYCYFYDPKSQTEIYLGAIDPVFGIIDSMSPAQQNKICDMFNTGESVWDIIAYIKDVTGYRLTKQSVYGWLRER